ncbi:MAG: two-component system response regulator [Bryobacteraceae bacterium]|nr:MAG: two-component system response regulator [Bryobacteraceae bacterium]
MDELVQPGTEPAAAPPPAIVAPPWMDSLGRATILLVDHVELNRQLIKGILKAGPYRLLEARSQEEAFRILDQEPVDLIISEWLVSDWSGRPNSGLEFCRKIKSNRRTHLIPILIVTSVQGIENEVAGLESGADEFLVKPLQPAVLRTRIRTMLRNKRVVDSLEEAETILFALAQTIEQRDKETGNHCQRLAALSVALGSALGLPEEDLLALHRGGYLHDIGKIAVPDAILFKQGELTPEEWVIMRSHTWKGEEICRPMRSLRPVLPIIRNHHERWDGSGYPDGLKGEDIPLLARILQLADIFDALTSQRSYKAAYPVEEAIAQLRREAELGWRDPELVSVFCEVVRLPSLQYRLGVGLPGAELPPETPELAAMRESLLRMSQQLLK